MLQLADTEKQRELASMTVKLRIKEVAEAKGYNMSSLSRATDISFNTIKRLWQNPDTGVNLQTLSKIADTLHVPLSELTEEVTSDKPDNHASE